MYVCVAEESVKTKSQGVKLTELDMFTRHSHSTKIYFLFFFFLITSLYFHYILLLIDRENTETTFQTYEIPSVGHC